MGKFTMDSFKLYSRSDILAFVNIREGEEKLGERVKQVDTLDQIKSSPAKFVLLGIPEDIGIRANFGVGGASTAWEAALNSLLNIQSNPFLSGEEILLLGHFEIEEPVGQTVGGLRNKTKEIDALVFPIIQKLISAGKIPIVIGGGHNNAAPIIAGVATALKHPINVVNIDAHADLRQTSEGRHSGNGFSYAIQEGHLKDYFIFGLHKNYVNARLLEELENNPKIKVAYFDELLQRNLRPMESWLEFTDSLSEPCGLEIDLDSIAQVLSSAITPSGFALNEIRQLILSNNKNYSYLHICEGAVSLADGRTDATTGKAIAYLVSDFIKALLLRISQKL
jgi:formiminoglutamase